jgi:hypothetical protein
VISHLINHFENSRLVVFKVFEVSRMAPRKDRYQTSRNLIGTRSDLHPDLRQRQRPSFAAWEKIGADFTCMRLRRISVGLGQVGPSIIFYEEFGSNVIVQTTSHLDTNITNITNIHC